MLKPYKLFTLLMAVTAVGAFQNCGGFQSATSGSSSRTVLGKDNVYGNLHLLNTMSEHGEYGADIPLEEVPADKGPEEPVIVEVPLEEPLQLPIKRHCDADKSYWWNYNGVGLLQGGTNAFVRITAADGSKLCEVQNVLEELKAGKITLPPNCFGTLTRQEFFSQLAYSDRTKPIKFQIFVKKNGTDWQINDPKKKKSDGLIMQQLDPSWVYMGNVNRGLSTAFCDQVLSPLFIDTRSASEYTARTPLTSPLQGTFFDLIGNFPIAPYTAFQKLRVSWFKDPKLMFLALPNAQGRVDGINQLFGDNTMGPDGRDADHGFHALSKYDGYSPVAGLVGTTSRDGVIDEKDWVFSRLRLWSDKNRNGVADPGELDTLKNQGIKSISLKYDPHYREMDRYFNEIRYKSKAIRSDGSESPVFDAFFKLPKAQ